MCWGGPALWSSRNPKKEEFVTGVTLGLDSRLWVPERIRQADGNVHVYEIWDVALPASLVTFSPPAGAEVADLR